jgi:hypothetical protein
MTGACTNPIYYQGLYRISDGHIVGSADDHNRNDGSLSSAYHVQLSSQRVLCSNDFFLVDRFDVRETLRIAPVAAK